MEELIEVVAKEWSDEKNSLADICNFIKRRLGSYEIMFSICKMDKLDYLNELYVWHKYNSHRKYSLHETMKSVYCKLISENKHDNLIYLSDTVGIDEDGEYTTFLDLYSLKYFSYNNIDDLECKINMEQIMDDVKLILSDTEYNLLRFRFGFDNGNMANSQSQASMVFGISKSGIARIEKRALVKLRKSLESKYNC